MLRLSLLTVAACVVSAVSAVPAGAVAVCYPAEYESSFSDVDGCTLYAGAIYALKADGIAEGVQTPTGRAYQPARSINRAEFTKLVLLASGTDAPPPCASAPFPDVPKDAWYAPYICAAKDRGIISGFPDGTFKPGIDVNFANGAKILVKSFGLATNPADANFSSDQNSIWFRPYTKALLKRSAVAESITRFDSPLTRGEMAEMLYRLGDPTRTSFGIYEPLEGTEPPTAAMGYDPAAAMALLGFSVLPPDPIFIYTPSTVRMYDTELKGYAFKHVFQAERCGASGLFEHCTPVFADWSIGFYETRLPISSLADEALLADHLYFGGRPSRCLTMGSEGENRTECFVALGGGRTLVVVRDFIDTNVAYTDVPGVTPVAFSDAMFARIRSSMEFAD